MQILQQQYLLTQKAREAMLTFVENSLGQQITHAMPAFNGKSIRDLLVHNAQCYLNWLDYFALRQPETQIDKRDFKNIKEIRRLYDKVDESVSAFFQRFGAEFEERISADPIKWGPGSATALEVFTHVMTHEFHHKGQVLSMCRQLGHAPPDTDISIAFSNE